MPAINLLFKKAHTPEFLKQAGNKFLNYSIYQDGSVTRMLELLSNKQINLLVLNNQKIKFPQFKEHCLNENILIQDQNIILREISLGYSEQNILIYARSYWSQHIYDVLISKNPQKPIGINLIEQKIQQFRQINWYGKSTIEVNYKKQELNCRSYSIKSGENIICEIEQFFTPLFYDLFL